MTPAFFTAAVTRHDGSTVHHKHCRMADVDRETVLLLYGEGDPLVAHYEASELRSLEVRWAEEGAS